jgi:predicted dehydrogenase
LRRFRVTVAGLGLVSQFWLPVLLRQPDVEIVAVVDPMRERRRRAAELYGLDRASESLDEALATAPNVVVNLTPPDLHRQTVDAALDAGCDVLSEKPLATMFEDAVAMVEHAERVSRTLSVMQNRRFAGPIRRLREGIESGAVGDPFQLSADMFMAPRHDNSYLEVQESPLLTEMAIHTFDQARYLSASEAVTVTCLEFDPPGSWCAGPAAAVCTFELANGAVFSYRGNWVAPGFATSYDAAWRISGPKGTAYWDSWGDPECEVELARAEPFGSAPVRRERWSAGNDLQGHEPALEHLLQALRDGRPAETDGRDNLRSLAMAFAALASSREGRRVELAELLPGRT